jgi:hypothetical protein
LEEIEQEDFSADSYLVLTTRALKVSYRRWHRNAVRVTNLRIISGTRPLFGPNHVIQHVLYPSDRGYPEEANTLSAGFFKYGYKLVVFDRARVRQLNEDRRPCLELRVDPAVGTGNLASFRIYSDTLQTFCLPD